MDLPYKIRKVDQNGQYFKGSIVPKSNSSKEQLLSLNQTNQNSSENLKLANAVRVFLGQTWTCNYFFGRKE